MPLCTSFIPSPSSASNPTTPLRNPGPIPIRAPGAPAAMRRFDRSSSINSCPPSPSIGKSRAPKAMVGTVMTPTIAPATTLVQPAAATMLRQWSADAKRGAAPTATSQPQGSVEYVTPAYLVARVSLWIQENYPNGIQFQQPDEVTVADDSKGDSSSATTPATTPEVTPAKSEDSESDIEIILNLDTRPPIPKRRQGSATSSTTSGGALSAKAKPFIPTFPAATKPAPTQQPPQQQQQQQQPKSSTVIDTYTPLCLGYDVWAPRANNRRNIWNTPASQDREGYSSAGTNDVFSRLSAVQQQHQRRYTLALCGDLSSDDDEAYDGRKGDSVVSPGVIGEGRPTKRQQRCASPTPSLSNGSSAANDGDDDSAAYDAEDEAEEGQRTTDTTIIAREAFMPPAGRHNAFYFARNQQLDSAVRLLEAQVAGWEAQRALLAYQAE